MAPAPSPGTMRGHSILGQVSMTTASPASVARAAASSSMTPSWSHRAPMPRRSLLGDRLVDDVADVGAVDEEVDDA